MSPVARRARRERVDGARRSPRRCRDGARFAGACGGRRRVARLDARRARSQRRSVLSCVPPMAGACRRSSTSCPAAEWDEREAHDLYGLRFDGHEPLRALVAHPQDPARWTIPVERRGRARGGGRPDPRRRDRVRATSASTSSASASCSLDPRLFYKHRGLERAAEGQAPDDGLAYARRACGACAVDQHGRLRARRRGARSACGRTATCAARARSLLELERLYNHLNDIGAICAGVGFAPGTMAFAALKERAQRLNRALAGPSLPVRLGRRRPPARSTFDCAAADTARGDAARAARRRRHGLARARVRRLAAGAARRRRRARSRRRRSGSAPVGPAARAAGVRARRPRATARACGTAASRRAAPRVADRRRRRPAASCARSSCEATCELLDELLSHARSRPDAARIGRAAPRHRRRRASRARAGRRSASSSWRTTASRGCTCAPAHTRTGPRWPTPPPGNLLPDFPLINKSFELCYACVDR